MFIDLDQAAPLEQPETLDSLSAPYSLPLFVDSSMIATFRSCRRKFYLSYCHNLKPRGNSIHLAAGSAIAAGLHAARQAQGASDVPLSHDQLCEAAIGPFLSAWGKDFSFADLEDHAKNPHNTFYALELYLEKHHPFFDSVQPIRGADNRPASEFSFALPLPIKHPSGDPFIYVGRFDLLGIYTTNQLLVVLDDKTTGSMGASWLAQWDLRGQFLGYLWALRKLGYQISHVLVRGIALLKTDIVLQDVPLQYPDHLIDRWETELYNTLNEMTHFYQEQYWPYNLADACSSYGGCPYKDLCVNKDPDQWLTNYKVEVWNPVGSE